MLTSVGHIKETWRLSLPVILTNLSYMSVGLADTFMIGRYDAIQMAAASFVTNVFAIFLVIAMGLAFGLTPLVAPAHAQQNRGQVRRYFSNALGFALMVGTLVSLGLYVATPLLGFMGQEQQVAQLSYPFFRLLAISFFPLILYFFAKQFAEGLSDTRHAMVISLAGNGLNILLNYLWIYGKGGFPEWGYMGAAYATLTARIFMAGGMVAVLVSRNKFRRYLSFQWGSITLNRQRALVALGLPIAGQFVLEAGSFSVAAVMAGWLGAEELAAFQITLVIAGTFYMIPSGMGNATTIRIGHFMGLKDASNIRQAGYTGYFLTIALALAAALLILFVHRELPALFVENPTVQALTVKLFLIVAGFQFSDGLNAVGLGNLRGLQDVKIPMLVVSLAFWLVGLPLGYYFSFWQNWGLYGLWAGLALALSIGALVLWLRFDKLSQEAPADPSSA